MSIVLFGFLRSKLKKLQLATEKRLSPLEEQFHALARANINMEPTVEESATGGIAALPKNAADGPFSRFMLEGDTRINVAENILKSGNFHDMSAWEILNIDPSQIYPYDGILTINFTGGEYYFYMSQTLAPKPGHRYYVQGEIQCVNCGIEITAGSQFRGVYDNEQYELISMISDSPTTLTFSISRLYDLNPTAYLRIRNWMVIDLGDESSPLYDKTEEELEEIFTEYFDGTYAYKSPVVEHAQGSYRIRRVGKNILPLSFDEWERGTIIDSTGQNGGDTINLRTKGYHRIIGGMNLVGKLNVGYRALNIYFYDANKQFLSMVYSINESYKAIPPNAVYYRARFRRQDDATITLNELETAKPQIEYGTTATEYEPYTAQDVYVNCGELRRLPNGVCDEYDVLSGIKIQKIKEKILQASDISSSIIQYTNVDVVVVNLTDNKPFTTSGLGDINIPGMDYTTYAERDNVANVGKYYVTSETPNRIQFIVAKGTTIEQARQQLVGTKIIYQLAQPIITPYYPQALTTKPSGTIYCEPILGDADFYGQGIVLEGYAFVGIEKVTKIDLESGVEIDVTDTCTLNEAKNGFTSTALNARDICWYELRLDPETTLIPEIKYAYYDSRYVVVDDSNGKYYRWKIASTDGVPRIELEEV